MKALRQRKAFTIVEMVIVIAVIAVLATVMIPTISGVIDKANVSVDQQLAASLNTQLALWELDNHKIANEKDLSDAINQYYGKYNDEGVLVDDFYSKLAPKSGDQGYHYWYNATDRQVILARYEDLLKADGGDLSSDPDMLPGILVLNAGIPEVHADPDERELYKFERNSPRSLLIQNEAGKKKNYFLMDKSGSELTAALDALADVTDNADYELKLQEMGAIRDDFAAIIVAKLNTTAIANNKGMFYAGQAVEHVYVLPGTTELAKSLVPADKLTGVESVYLPSTVTKIGTGSLLGFPVDSTTDPAMWEGSTTIYANTTEDNLTGFVFTDSFNCVLQLPTGDRYAFVNGVLTKLGTNDTFTTNYSVELESFTVSVPADANKKYDLHTDDDGTRTLHYTSDFTGSITLTAGDFKDTNGDYVARTAVWTVGEASTTANTLTLTKAELDANTTITVAAQNLTYTITIEKISIDSFTTSVSGVTGEPQDTDKDGVVDYYESTLEYKAGTTWTIAANVTLNPILTCVSMSNDVTLALSGTGASNLTIDGNTLKVNSGVSSNFEATLTITTKGFDKNGEQLSVNYNLTFKQASSTFAIADNANTQAKYGIKFTVGTVQPIKLGTLFKLESGEPSNIVVTWSNNGGDATDFNLTSQSGDWTEWEITPGSAGENFAIAISDGGATCTLYVAVKDGAYNVATAEQWLSVPNQKSIAILKPFTMTDTETKLSTAMNGGTSLVETGEGKVSKYMVSAKMYGNYNKITFGKFLIKSPNSTTGSNNYFLYSNGGLFEYVVIDGPEYNTVAKSWKSSQAANGYYVAGLEVTGSTKIDHCYISGFRSPVRVDGGNITISNSTLQGGAYASIYVRGATSLTLNDTITIQKKNEHGKIGAGVYFDCLNKNGEENTVSFVLNGETHLYNWLSNSETYSDTSIKAIKSALFDGGCDSDAVNFVHNFADSNGKTDDRVNACVAAEKDGSEYDAFKQLTITDNSNGVKLCTKAEAVTSGNYSAYSYAKCSGTCTHEMFPDNNPNYDVADFLAAEKVN